MIDKEKIGQSYEAILQGFFKRMEEESFFNVAELSKALVLEKAGPDVLVDIHATALKKVIGDINDPMIISRMVINANELLLNGIMAYAMTYYDFLDQLAAERQKIEDARQEADAERDKLDNIVSAIDADLLLLDPEMKILWVNRRLRERNPYIKDSIIGHPCNKAYCNIESVPDDCPATLAFRNKKPIRQEHPITHPDGTSRYYYFTCSPIFNSNGEVSHVLELVQDITERHEIEKALKRKTIELEEKNTELERFNKLFVDREFRIKELKERVKELEKE